MDLDIIANLAKSYYIDNGMDISDDKKYLLVVDNARRRVNNLSKMPEESQMFYNNLDISNDSLDLVNCETSQKLLNTIHATLTKKIDCNGDQFKTIVMEVGKDLEVNGKDLFFPVRIALYGNPKGPDIPHIFSILGREKTLDRLSQVIK